MDHRYECESTNTDKVKVVMPNGEQRQCKIPVPPNNSAAGPREKRLTSPDVTVKYVKEHLLTRERYDEKSFSDYEMVIILSQGATKVMKDDTHISNYRSDLCVGAEVHLEIRLRPIAQNERVPGDNRDPNPSHPEDFNIVMRHPLM
uniref:Uncharacterized protein n=1 Tax=Arion vulgaris TaxID=1028688 RepID=A0A0B6YTQ4_9EUPU